jgi:hypothetical protein
MEVSILTDLNGIPIGWAVDSANRHDSVLLPPTLEAAAKRGLRADIHCRALHPRFVIAKQRRAGEPRSALPQHRQAEYPSSRPTLARHRLPAHGKFIDWRNRWSRDLLPIR